MQGDKQLQNQITATQISLPKGGGTIQGIGETFQANEFTGTASLSIPIKTSSCRGFEPQLSIDYSSGSGNGSFGLGFDLSIPNISRKTSKGLPKYDSSDTFLLFNGDDLVPESDGSREAHRACAAPGWGLSVIDEFVSLVNPVLFEPPFPPEGAADLFEIANKIKYTVISYRPRTEGLFAQIEHWVSENDDSC